MKHTITSEWKGNLTFEATVGEHKIINDAPLATGGDNLGTSPKKLLLVALAGCTGMDVVSILKKNACEYREMQHQRGSRYAR